jgi:hypothetical protein
MQEYKMQVIFNQFNQCRKSKMLVAQKKNIELPHKTLYLPSGQDEPLPDEEGSGDHDVFTCLCLFTEASIPIICQRALCQSKMSFFLGGQ